MATRDFGPRSGPTRRLLDAAAEAVRADPRLSLTRDQADTRTTTGRPNRTERAGRQFGPTSGPGITPRAALAMGNELRAQEAQRRAEARRDLTPEERAELPGSALRGDAFHDYQLRAAEAEATNQAGLGGALEGLANIFTFGLPSAVRTTIEDPSALNVGMLAASVTPLGPFFRAGRAGVAASRALSRADDVAGVAKAAFSSPGRGTRYVRLADSSIQFYSSPSVVTRGVQRGIDRASEALTGKVGTLRSSRNVGARAVGKALTPLSSRGRVPKRGGRLERRERGRAVARRSAEIELVRNVGRRRLRSDSPEAEAFFWEAQVPPGRRGPQLFQDLIDDLKTERMLLSPEQIARDPQRLMDIENQIQKLVRAKAYAGRYDERAMDAAHVLVGDRERIMAEAGVPPDTVINRTGLLTRRLYGDDAESAGALYIGHRPSSAGEPAGTIRATAMPTTGNVGAARRPSEWVRQNTLELYRSGRLSTDPDHIIRDWERAQAYEFNTAAKDTLGQMGAPLQLGQRIDPKTQILVNTQGHRIPRSLRQGDDDLGRLDPDEIDEIIDVEHATDLEQYIENYLGHDAATIRRMMDEFAAGNPLYQDIRVVPRDVAGRYFSQLTDPRIIINHPFLKTPGRAGRAFDIANDVLYMSLIYSSPGYIPANVVSNLIFAGLHQGAFLPVNIARAGQLLARGPKDVRRMALNEVGAGASAAAASSFLKGPARVMGSIADDMPRLSALIHEAAKAGVISKVKPKLSQRDFDALRDFFTNPRWRPVLNDAADRGQEAMVRFDRLTPIERAVFRRAMFVWPWVRGAAAWPVRFAMDYPLRAGALGAGAYYANEKLGGRRMEGMPPWLRGAVQVGEQTIDGKTYPLIFNTGPVSPVSTAYDFASTLAGREGFDTYAEMLNPGLQALLKVAQKQTPYGGEIEGGAGAYLEAARQAGLRLTPQAGLVGDLISPSADGGLYPGDTSRLGRLARASRVLPYPVDPEKAAELSGDSEPAPPEPRRYEVLAAKALASADFPAEVKAHVRLWKQGHDLVRYGEIDLARRLGLMRESDPDMPAVSRLTDRQKYAVRIGVLARLRPGWLPADWREYYKQAWDSGDEKVIGRLRHAINRGLSFADVYGASLGTRIEENTR